MTVNEDIIHFLDAHRGIWVPSAIIRREIQSNGYKSGTVSSELSRMRQLSQRQYEPTILLATRVIAEVFHEDDKMRNTEKTAYKHEYREMWGYRLGPDASL